MKKRSLACIIPFYNEQTSILKVLDVVTNVHPIKQIICIDDGSTDFSSKSVQSQHYPNLTLLKLPTNVGKTKAVEYGLGRVTEDAVFMMDADLENVTIDELEMMINRFFKSNLDILIVKVDGGNTFIDRLLLRDVILSGIRILKTSDLKEILKGKMTGYQLEVGINKYMIQNNKRVGWIQGKLLNVFKQTKWGLINGFVKSYKMEMSILIYLGLFGYIKQMIFAFRWQID
jgi:glycosyltransferase involved in cell wall biosynthesis